MIMVGMVSRHTRKKKGSSKRKNKQNVYIGGQGVKRCVIVKMVAHEGLGNQLFILAAGLVAHTFTKLPLCIIPSNTNPHATMDYRKLFQMPSEIQMIEGANANSRIAAANSILEPKNGQATAPWSNANIKYNASSTKNAKIQERLYQNYSGIQKVIPVVKDILMKNEFSSKDIYRDLESDTQSKTSAFIHVRRGDYEAIGWVLGADYYLRGLDELEKDMNIKTVWIISNDLDWCSKVKWDARTKKTIKFYDSKNELEVLYKMILCMAGAVISPSTFSAWGAMMGADLNPRQATIVYPFNWLTHDTDGDNPLMFPKCWIGIPNSIDSTTTLL